MTGAGNRSKSRRPILYSLLFLVVLLGAFARESDNPFKPVSGLRGVWVQARSIGTPDQIDEMLARVEAGNFNAIFLNVFTQGFAFFESELLDKHPKVAPDYDPLAYVIERASEQGIAVHAWLVAGPVDYESEPNGILLQHPDWAMEGPDGRLTPWLNYNRPDVRQFIADVALEILERYEIQGVHFDYTRYPGPQWGFDDYSAQEFAREYGLDLELLRYSELPAYASFSGNPLTDAKTAQVLAEFDNGLPAVLLNNYGAGQVLILNWDASERQVGASTEILRRGIDHMLGENATVFILRSETDFEEYNTSRFNRGKDWIKDLGWTPVDISEAELADLPRDALLVMPNIYLIPPRAAADLADFVRDGGHVVFIDGPTHSIADPNIQAITGMSDRGRHFSEPLLLIATAEHDLIPVNSSRGLTLADYQALDAQWKTFRAQGLNRLLRDVYQRVKDEFPDVLVTITISADQDRLAEEHLLDWQAWLEGGYVDRIIPRAYVDQDESLTAIIADWRPMMRNSGLFTLGLLVHNENDSTKPPKTPGRLLSEIEQARASGSNGVILFNIDRIGDNVLEALAHGPFVPPTPQPNSTRQVQ